MRTVIICASTSYLGMLVNVYVHMDDLARAMTTKGMLIPVTIVMWLYTYCRYLRRLTITVIVKQVVIKQSITVSALLKSNTSLSQKSKPREGSLFYTVSICFRLGRFYDNALKRFIGNEKNTQISPYSLETRMKHITVKENVTSAKSSFFPHINYVVSVLKLKRCLVKFENYMDCIVFIEE